MDGCPPRFLGLPANTCSDVALVVSEHSSGNKGLAVPVAGNELTRLDAHSVDYDACPSLGSRSFFADIGQVCKNRRGNLLVRGLGVDVVEGDGVKLQNAGVDVFLGDGGEARRRIRARDAVKLVARPCS
jgi:hypothetical protein